MDWNRTIASGSLRSRGCAEPDAGSGHRSPARSRSGDRNLTHALNRMGIYSALGAPEVWRFDGTFLQVELLQADQTYRTVGSSPSFPALPVSDLVPFLQPSPSVDSLSAMRAFRAWVREQLGRNKAEKDLRPRRIYGTLPRISPPVPPRLPDQHLQRHRPARPGVAAARQRLAGRRSESRRRKSATPKASHFRRRRKTDLHLSRRCAESD